MAETNVLGFEELQELLLQKKYAEFIKEIDQYNPVDSADLLSQFPEDQVSRVFRLFKKDIAAEVFAELDSDLQELIIAHMTDREIAEMLEELYTDDAVDMLEEMPANVVKRIMKNATPETREEINRFLAYPEKSAGSVMTSEFIDLRKNMTCEEAIKRIRRIGLDKETVYVAYVTDEKRVLEGVVVLKQLLFATPDQLIGDIMNENVLYATTHDDQEKVADMISHYGVIALPIVLKAAVLPL